MCYPINTVILTVTAKTRKLESVDKTFIYDMVQIQLEPAKMRPIKREVFLFYFSRLVHETQPNVNNDLFPRFEHQILFPRADLLPTRSADGLRVSAEST